MKIKNLKLKIRKTLSIVLVILIVLSSIKFLILKPKNVFADSTIGFNEGYGTTVSDNSGNISGTITNAVWKQADLCKVGNCLYFDGTGDYVSFGDDADLDHIAADNFTIEGWFRTPDITSGQRTLVAKHNATAGGYKVYMDSNGYLIFGVDDDSTWTPDDSASTSTTAFDDNKWHFFSAVKTGTTSITIYVDGIQYQTDSTIAATGTLANSDAYYLGIDGNGSSNGFSGFLDEVKIYNTARSSSEIKTDISGQSPSRGIAASFNPDQSHLSDGLIGYWKMDETSGNASDSSGNGLALTNNGTTTYAAGKFGNASSFNGTTQYLSTSTSIPSIQTVSFWTNPGNSTDNFINLISGTAYINSSSGIISATGFTSPSIYVNGVLNGTITASSWNHVTITSTAGITANAFEVGRANSAYLTSGGKIDETRVYNRALSPAEVSQLYNFAPGPLGYWKFDENTGTIANDSSGNNNSGTLANGPLWSAGKFGSGISFDGSNDNITQADDADFDFATTDNFTIESWIKHSASISSGENTPIQVNATADDTTTSTTYVVMNSMSITPGAGDYMVWFSTTLDKSVGTSDDWVTMYVNGSQIAHTERMVGGDSSYNSTEVARHPVTIQAYVSGVGAGQAIDIRWKTTTGNTSTAFERTLIVQPVNSANMSQASATDSPTTTSTTDTQITSMTLTPGAGDYIVYFSADVTNTTAGSTFASIYVNGAQVAHSEREYYAEASFVGAEFPISTQAYVSGVGAGQVIEIKWRVTAGTATMNERTFTVQKVTSSNISQVTATADDTCTFSPDTCAGYSSSDSQIGSMTLTPGAGDYLIIFSTSIKNSVGSTLQDVTLYVNGTQITHTERELHTEFSFDTGDIISAPTSTHAYVTGVGDGQAIEARFKTTGGTMTAHERTLTVMKLNATATIIAKYETTGVDGGYKLYMEPDGDITCGVDNDDSGFPLDSATSTAATYNDGVWHHVACVKSGSTSIKLYIDSVEVASDVSITTSGTYANDDSIYFGIDGNGTSNPWLGQLDNLQIYNYARSQRQVVEDMNGGHPAPGSPIGSSVAKWKMDEGYGTTAHDNSINGNDLTLSTVSWTNSGKFGKAFNGLTNVRLSRTDDADLDFAAADDATFSVWFKSDSATNPSANEYLLEKGGNVATPAIGYAIYTASSGGTICFGIDDDATSFPEDSVCSSSDLYDNTWHHIVAKKTGATRLDLYVDGKPNGTPDTSISATGTLENASTFYIGDTNGTDGTDEFLGDIDEVQIFRAALAESQIQSLYNQGSSASMGALSTDSSNNASNSDTDSYCPPGQGSACTGPVAEWRLDENAGTTANDSSGNANTGTITAGSGNYNAGKFGSSYSFDSASTSINSGSGTSIDNLPSAGMTINSWIYPKSAGEGSLGFIVAKNVGSTPSAGWILRMDSTTSLTFTVDGSTDLVRTTNTSVLTQNTWNNVTVTWDGIITTAASVHIYINGIEVGYATSTNGAARVDDGTSTLFIGNDSTSARTFDGYIDALTLYNYVRTPAQIAWDINHGAPVGWWKLDENTGTTANDSAGNSTAGTLTNTPTWATGKLNTGVSFAGSNQQILIADDPDFDFADDESMSVTGWFKHTTASVQEIILSKYAAAGYKVVMESDGDITCGLDYDATWTPTDSATSTLATYDDNSWHHFACVKNGATSLSLYIDGILIATDSSITATNTLTNADPLYLGIDADGTSNDYTGTLDDIRIYRYPLTAQQIKAIMNNGAAVKY